MGIEIDNGKTREEIAMPMIEVMDMRNRACRK
jgi:hypothetical protein